MSYHTVTKGWSESEKFLYKTLCDIVQERMISIDTCYPTDEDLVIDDLLQDTRASVLELLMAKYRD